jgi:hypothetical protein
MSQYLVLHFFLNSRKFFVPLDIFQLLRVLGSPFFTNNSLEVELRISRSISGQRLHLVRGEKRETNGVMNKRLAETRAEWTKEQRASEVDLRSRYL